MSQILTLADMTAKASLSEDEIRGAVDVIEHISAFQRDARLSMTGVSLSGYIVSNLIEAGTIPGHSMTGDTLQRYSPPLASALQKIEAMLPNYSRNPLAAGAGD